MALALTAIVITFLTWLVWDSGNKVQDAVQADADARIQEAKGVAAKADERSRQLEHDNLVLRGDLTAQEGKVAGLQKDSANARAAQQKVETDLAKQQEMTANAERELEELKETMRPRSLTQPQQASLVKLLSGEPKGEVEILCVIGNTEGCAFANQIDKVLKAAGWTVKGGGISQAIFSSPVPVGVVIIVRNAITAPPFAARLQRAFFSIGVPIGGVEQSTRPEGSVEIVVEVKATAAN